MAFLRRMARGALLLVAAGAPVLLEAGSAPMNVEGGVVLPSQLTESIGRAPGYFQVGISPAPSGEFTLQSADLAGGSSDALEWHDAPGAWINGAYSEAISAPGRVFRLVYSDETEIRLEGWQVPEVTATNRTLTFSRLPGWEHWLQIQPEGGSGAWVNVGNAPLGGNFVNPPPAHDVRIVARPPIEREKYEAILVGGQSNAELHDAGEAADAESRVVYLTRTLSFAAPGPFQTNLADAPFSYSFSLEAAQELSETETNSYLLIPVAVGGTTITQWLPAEDRFNRSTLFGDANFRRVIATPRPVRAIWYYGHESSTVSPDVDHYADLWRQLTTELRKETGPAPILFAQLAKSTDPVLQERSFRGAELQRLAEEGQPNGNAGQFVVVTFDLPLGDVIHLDGDGQRELGRRFALAMREHVYGEAVDGTGPRLEGVEYEEGDRTRIWVRFDREINEAVKGYDQQFQAKDGEEIIPLAEIRRGDDRKSVLLRLAHEGSEAVELTYGNRPAAGVAMRLWNVIQDENGLPAPVFGPVAPR